MATTQDECERDMHRIYWQNLLLRGRLVAIEGG
jgi:hypothetical protein